MAKKRSMLSKLLNPGEKTPEEVEAVKKVELEKYGVKPVEKVEVEDPITGEKRIISIDRAGYSEQKLIVALADPTVTRDRKDFMLSMYMFERGRESASFVADIMRYKGAHTRETRVFKSQMRFDFEMLVTMLAGHMRDQALRTASILGLDLKATTKVYKDWLKEAPENAKCTYLDFVVARYEQKVTDALLTRCALVSQAIFDYEQAERIEEARKRITEAREREKGKGIYLSAEGKPYLHDDPELDDALLRDRELTAEAQEDHD